MDTRTGEIVPFRHVEDLKQQGDKTANFYKKIPEKYLQLLQSMNRKQRRDWYRKNRKLFRDIN